MKFVDSCEVDVAAGKGGNGSIAFRREKFVPFGGPSGGDGGRGGDIVFQADEGLSTLLDLTYARTIRAKNGEMGHGKDMYGRGAEDYVVRVPVGTQVFDRDSGELMFDIDSSGARVVVARGGKGGRGNIHFATPYDRAPRRSEPGEPGEEKRLRLELKVMADVGLLGFPNVGKSTFIRAVSRAQPKVADYPFTTLTPHLGVVRIGDEATMVVADIPGLIPGAADGAGLGHRFLKHVERTRALLHLVTLDFGEERDPLADYDALMKELARFDEDLAKRPQLVALSKADLPEVREAYPMIKARFKKRKIDLHLVSAATGEGVRELSVALYRLVTGHGVEDWELPRAPKSEPAPEPAPPPATAKKPAAKKPAAKKAAAKKPAAKKAAPKPAAKKPAAKKTAAKKPAAKKPAAKKLAAKKLAAKKAKAVAKKPAAKKKSAVKKPAVKAGAKKAKAKSKARARS